MKLNDDALSRATSAVMGVNSERFSILVDISGLDPKKDFRYANLQDVDFRDSDLEHFDFSYADLRGAIWDQPLTSEPGDYRYALFGKPRDPICSVDWDALRQQALHAKTWGERFFAFALVVDNFGTSNLTITLLKDMLNDKSTYCSTCVFVYFAGSYVSHGEALDYCKIMASAGNALTNQYRISKMRRLARELASYLETLKPRAKFPGEVSPKEIMLAAIANDPSRDRLAARRT